ncbi:MULTISPECIES: DUF481 domain-containing protein [Spongiibacter]|uniref:DUF481 domain-containing protein n=1 Tax=Spongiibacter TaxID=630749 RepID=UPI000C0958BB|nr:MULTISPECIES: DUF481 domain-containing protein [unclassified Spongiibacter]MAK43208.1 hypothetical protein [Spongiibacter sp.]
MRVPVSIVLSLLCANAAQADETPTWEGDVEFGYYQTDGNSNETSLLAKGTASRKSGLWTNVVKANAQNSEVEGVRSEEQYFISDRLSYDISDFNYSFGYVSVDKDRFSGYVYQATIAGGYGRRLLKNDRVVWDAEVGPGFRISEFDTGSAEGDGKTEEAILRLSTDLKAKVSETATFEQSLSVESGDKNTVSKSVTALKTKIIGGFGLKISYTMEYNEVVPNSNVHMDKQTAVTLVYSF